MHAIAMTIILAIFLNTNNSCKDSCLASEPMGLLKLLMQPWKSFYFAETAKPSWRFGLINHKAGIGVSTNKENCAKECRREHCELVANGFKGYAFQRLRCLFCYLVKTFL
jgi:hypothetical protein